MNDFFVAVEITRSTYVGAPTCTAQWLQCWAPTQKVRLKPLTSCVHFGKNYPHISNGESANYVQKNWLILVRKMVRIASLCDMNEPLLKIMTKRMSKIEKLG